MVLSHTLGEYRSVNTILSVDKWAISGVRVRPGLNMPEELHVLSFLIHYLCFDKLLLNTHSTLVQDSF